MDRRAHGALASISLLALVGVTVSTQDGSVVLVAQQAPQQRHLSSRLPSIPTPVGNAEPTIAVRVYDYVRVSEVTSDAQEVASRIFREAGIKVEWHACLPPVPKSSDDSACTHELGSTEVLLRIIAQIKVFPGVDHDAVGFASGPYATVAFARVTDLARSQSAPPFVTLGRVMAHEIGHVLLRTQSHAPEGIMRAQWGGGELRENAANDMLFTRKQSQFLHKEVSARMRQVRDESTNQRASDW